MRIAIASDEAGHDAKERLAAKLIAGGHEVTDAAPPVPGKSRTDYAEQVARWQCYGTMPSEALS